MGEVVEKRLEHIEERLEHIEEGDRGGVFILEVNTIWEMACLVE